MTSAAAASRDRSESSPSAPSAAEDERALRAAPVDRSQGADWDAFVAATPDAELYHDYRWRALIEDVFGHETYYLAARDRTDVLGVLPLARLRSRLFGDFLVSLPFFNYGGVLAASERARRALTEAAAALGRSLGVRHVELRHRAGVELEWPAREDKVALSLALPGDEDALFKSFTSKLRAQIRRPQKVGATARTGGIELLDDFYRVFATNMRDLGTPVYARRFFAAVMERFAGEARIFVVDLGGRPVAASLTLTHRGTMEVPWASSLREANKDGVNMLLYWAMLQAAVEQQCARFDFGRSTADSGTYRFKLQWGAQPEALRWHYWLASGGELPQINPDNPKYAAAIAVWKRLPLPVANVLGPHVVKFLP